MIWKNAKSLIDAIAKHHNNATPVIHGCVTRNLDKVCISMFYLLTGELVGMFWPFTLQPGTDGSFNDLCFHNCLDPALKNVIAPKFRAYVSL